jgi:hypothetical protein
MMESFEYTKDFLLISGIDSDAIILNRKTAERAPRPGNTCRRNPGRGNVYPGRLLRAILERVCDEILKHLMKVRFPDEDLGQSVISHCRAALAQRFREARQALLENGLGIHRQDLGLDHAGACVLEQFADQPCQAPPSFFQKSKVLLPVSV